MQTQNCKKISLWNLIIGLVHLFVNPVFCVNWAYFKMYDVDTAVNNNGETVVMKFSESEPHLSNDFQGVMANTHQICTNGLWRLFPGSLYTLTGSYGVEFPTGFGFGSSTDYETCITLSQSQAIALSTMGSLRRVGPKNLEDISLRTYTGPYYSGIESVIDGQNMEDRNLRGYMDSYVITGPRYQHPDNYSAFIPVFQFFEFDRYTGEKMCIVMGNDQHGNAIPRKGAAFTASVYEEQVVDGEMGARFGSVKLIPYSYVYYNTESSCPQNSTIYVPEGEGYGDDDYDNSYYSQTSYGGGYGYQGNSAYKGDTKPRASHPSYESPSYQPSYSPPAYKSTYYSPPAYEPPAYHPSYSPPSYEPSAYQPSYSPPSYEPSAYQPSYSPPAYQPSYSYQPSYQPSYEPSYQPGY